MNAVEYAEQLAIAWRNVLHDPTSGRLTPSAEKVLADLMEITAFRKPLLKAEPIPRPIDAMEMAMAEGRRQVFLRILDALALDPLQLRTTKEAFTDGSS